ncbi:SRPBCC family protein [Pedobacter sandarakinus]|uniref:SRPBCC family protein n=1 Tax=Pedobacter sandarakinus TaxID=353156 RepID=UPI0022486A8F|nr:SRPBCC family protein [Pedobacter sandarakinus]MCX2575532.1 SRPBCC family protein [Pedobacter sandarakinus]
MKILKVLLGIVAVLAIIFVVGSFLLPKTYVVTRSIIVDAPDSVIYKNVADFREFYKWNPWAKMETSAKVSFEGAPESIGHQYDWKGNETGSGYMKIKSLETNKMIDMDLKFIEPFESMADTKFEILPQGTSNKVTWTMSGTNNMIGKWMCVFVSMDKMVGKDFENGLKGLKEKSEQKM